MKGALAASHMEILQNFSLETLAVFFPLPCTAFIKRVLMVLKYMALAQVYAIAGRELIKKEGWSSYLLSGKTLTLWKGSFLPTA